MGLSDVLTQPALGQDIQLGMLYDVRTSHFYGGVSLWDNAIVNEKQALDEHQVQNAEFIYSYSLEEARRNAGLDVEASLSLELEVVKVSGSAKYLNTKQTSTYETRIDASCAIARRTRRIPQETLSSMQHTRHLDDPRFTHFVGEVVEGGAATLSFVRNCASKEEATEVTGKLKAEIVGIPIGGEAQIDHKSKNASTWEGVKISYSGAMAESVTTLDDALRVAHEMPEKLKRQLNTIQYKLLPLSIVDSKVSHLIRDLDANLVEKTAAALKAGDMVQLRLQDLVNQDLFEKRFPIIKQQITNVRTAFARVRTDFIQAARRLLPQLRDGTTDESAAVQSLETAATLYEQRTRLAQQFIDRKNVEVGVLRATIASLLAEGFEDHLSGLSKQSLTETQVPRLLLSLGGPSINRTHHPLQAKIESTKIGAADDSSDEDDDSADDVDDAANGDNSNDNDDDDGEADEWFDSPQTVASLRNACELLRQQRQQCALEKTAPAVFGLADIDKAYRPGRKKRVRTKVGAIVLDYKAKLMIVTDMIPRAPEPPVLAIAGQTINVSWAARSRPDAEAAIPTTGYTVRYRSQANPLKDGPLVHVTEKEQYCEISCDSKEATSAVLGPLAADCDYSIQLRCQTIIGPSAWSTPVVGRTIKLTSVVPEMIRFFQEHQADLTLPRNEAGPWALSEATGRSTLVLGKTPTRRLACTDKRYRNQTALAVVDVAPEFRPQIPAADINDPDNTIVVVFVGSRGHGKSTEINAFVSYLLGGEPDDAARVLVIDDNSNGSSHNGKWVTQIVTCYRIRPLSPLFEGKTLLVVDTPGYGDARGVERDAFVTAAMYELFKEVKHINAVLLTVRAGENRASVLGPVATYVGSLFAKNVQRCLRTVYTFSDAGAPPARRALQELLPPWPVASGEAEVNNAAFALELDSANRDKIRDWWPMSVRGQQDLMRMLLGMSPVFTAASASVTVSRLAFEAECAFVEKKLIRTAGAAQSVLFGLDTFVSGSSSGSSSDNGRQTLLAALDDYLRTQQDLPTDIHVLASLTEELSSTALLHDPSALISYIETLIQAARLRGAPPEQLMQLTAARNALVVAREVKDRGREAAASSRILLDALTMLRDDLARRMDLPSQDRGREDGQPCSLYNDLYARLPPAVQEKAPHPLEPKTLLSSGALYLENLRAVGKLVRLMLKDSSIRNPADRDTRHFDKE
ncbi:fibronectin, type 3 [Grosmannia clavigera kw1407]|uniref:Fibronectin, type 3 n=1 Tax=Grosmannia clavigera (strain kw1407 / UAMH 11150) TaxID=655863 RepID=F0XNN2_GROCL|nr:fibronectin, type 3 [Grosmannia clavigera kw1407]EFX00284.1 fibronectin, type 3 [Grosmannia clavigera kw1407]